MRDKEEKRRDTSNGSRHEAEVRRYLENLPPDFDTWSKTKPQ